VQRFGWSSDQASAVEDRARRRAIERANARASGDDFDPVLEGAGGDRVVRAARREWSKRLGRFVTWTHDAVAQAWVPAGYDSFEATLLRREAERRLGVSLERAFAADLREARP